MVSAYLLRNTLFSRLFSKKNTPTPSGEDLAFRQVSALKGAKRLPSLAQIRQLPRILSSKERFVLFSGIGLWIFGAILLLGSIFSLFFVTTPRSGGSLTHGILGYPQLINPLYAEANSVDEEIGTLVYSGLLAYSPTLQTLEPALAESWTVSEDEKTYTLILKSGLVWHDNEPLTLEDILFTYRAVQDPAYGSPLFTAYQNVTFAASDERTIVFTLTEPRSTFADLLTLGILPAHLWEDISPTNARLAPFNIKPVGSGPYRVEKITKDSSGVLRGMTLRENTHFFGKPPFIPEILLKFFSHTSDIVQALQTKRIDTATALSFSDIAPLAEDRTVSITPLPLFQYVAAFFNTKKGVLSESSVRNALSNAVDISAVTAQATNGLANPTNLALPGFPQSNIRVQNVLEAETLLDAAGWIKNDAGKRTKNGADLSLSIVTAERPELLRSAYALADAWNVLGISTTITPLARESDISSALQTKTYDVFIAAMQYGITADPYPFFHTPTTATSLNISQFSTPEMDAATTTLRTSRNPEKRAEAFTALSDILTRETPALFLFQNVVPLIHGGDILGITSLSIPRAEQYWTLLSSWYRKTGLSLKR